MKARKPRTNLTNFRKRLFRFVLNKLVLKTAYIYGRSSLLGILRFSVIVLALDSGQGVIDAVPQAFLFLAPKPLHSEIK